MSYARVIWMGLLYRVREFATPGFAEASVVYARCRDGYSPP